MEQTLDLPERRTESFALKAKWLWTGLALVVIAGAFGWFHVQRSHERDKPVFETTAVSHGHIEAKVTATGTLSAIVTVQVGTQVSGTIAELHADFNSKVQKGQLVAKIDPSLFNAAVQQARANVTAAAGNLAKAKAQAVDADRQAVRARDLLAQKMIAQADSDTAQATADADRAGVDAAVGGVEQAKAQLHQGEVNLAYTDIRSPTEGTVISRNVDVGQTVAASLQAPVLFAIAQDLKKMQVDTSVAEADIGKINPGTRATFSVDAYPGERFAGTVRQVRNAPQTVQNVVTYDAVIDVDNADLKLKPGMTANCTFLYAEKDDALRVPNGALRFVPPPELLASLKIDAKAGPNGSKGPNGPNGFNGPNGPNGREGRGGGGAPGGHSDRKPVWVLRDGKPVRVPVRIGITDGAQTEIVDGDLKDGDLVITDVTMGASARAASTSGSQQNFPRRMF